LRSLLRRLLLLALTLAAIALAGVLWLMHYPSTQTADPEPVDEYVYLGQGWGPKREAPLRQSYYYTAQGTSLKDLRYRWFVALELPWGKRRFADPEHMRAFGFVVDPVPTPANPDRLPVGFTRHFDPALGEDVLDISCAACHTGELHATANGRRYAVRIDGGPATHAFTSMRIGGFGPVLLGSLASTYLNPFKFDRFARVALGDAYAEGKPRLRRDLRAVLGAFLKQARNDRGRHLYPVEEGFGRTDALGRISNTVFGDELDPSNYRVANAPVSYPYLWNIWKFDWVQYNASVSQPMARNLGESLGVGARIHLQDAYGRPLPQSERFRAATLIDNLVKIEDALQQLEPPPWPEALLGAVDRAKAERGRLLFAEHCEGCHAVREADAETKAAEAPLRGPSDPLWVLHTLPYPDIGTDPGATLNFVRSGLDLRPAGLAAEELRAVVRPVLETQLARRLEVMEGAAAREPDRLKRAALQAQAERKKAEGEQEIARALGAIDPARVSLGAALNYVGLIVRQRYYDERGFSQAQRDCIDGFGTLDTPQVIASYKARPLAGTWATAPFLHNGSVPTLYDLLSPMGERPRRFYLGRREYDPVRVGFVTEPLKGAPESFWFDTRLPGNANTGHEFRAGYVPWQPGGSPQYGVIGPELSPDERWALVEYLKVHEDPPTPAGRLPPQCF
jgi:mono/diheme cytochrome c family protein